MSITFGAVLIHVSDLDRAKAWFEDMLRMETIEYDPEYLFLKMKLGETLFYIEASNPDLAAGLNAHAIGIRSQAVFQVDDLEAFAKELQTKGATLSVPPTRQYYGGFDAIVADPDGNEFILHEKGDED